MDHYEIAKVIAAWIDETPEAIADKPECSGCTEDHRKQTCLLNRTRQAVRYLLGRID